MIKPFLYKFYLYQKIRFPILIVALSLLPAILSSATIIGISPSFLKIATALVCSILYLLHIRIIDEQRDFDHDNKHHKKRPLQTGVISLQELKQVDVAVKLLFLLISAIIGIDLLLVGVLMMTFSDFAAKDFLLKEKIRQHFFLYNAINTVQTLIMQIYIYTFFAGFVPITNLIILHFFFTASGTVIFELVRKIKIPGQDGTGKDTYSWHLGFNNAIEAYLVLTSITSLLFYQIITKTTGLTNSWILFSISMFGVVFLFALFHLIKKTMRSEQLMQLSFILIYVTFNLMIYLSRTGT